MKNSETIEFRGITYTIYRVEASAIKLHWRDSIGNPYRQLALLQKELERRGEKIKLLTNAGIFEPGGVPTGLHIESGKMLRPLNTKDAYGNFYLKPNGVFLIVGEKAKILESNEFKMARIKPRLAIQSGPLLLRNGKIHHRFNKNSKSKLHRNGVGVDRGGIVIFAMTNFDINNRVNLFSFSEFFKHLGCADALFLDGDISTMEIDPKEPIAKGNHFGAIFSVTQKIGVEGLDKK